MNAQIEKLTSLQNEAKAIFEKAKGEGRELTKEEYARKDAILSDFAGLKKTIEAEKELAGMSFMSSVVTEAKGPKAEGFDGKSEAKEQFYRHLRTGESNKYVITTGTGSGVMLPKEVALPAIVRRPWNAYLAALAISNQEPIFTDGTEAISLPVMDDTANTGQAQNEDGSSSTTGADPSIPALTLGSNLYTSLPSWISNTQLAAVQFDIEAYILRILQKRIDLRMDAAWTTKFLTLTPSATVTTAATNGTTFAETEKFYHALPYQFRSDGIFILSDGQCQVFESLTDSQGRPLINMVDSISNGVLKTLKGCPVVISPSLSAPAAAAVSGIFVSAESLKVRIVKNARIARYTNVPIDAYRDMVGFEQFSNADFNASPGFAFLKGAAS